MDLLCFFCLCERLFICALWSPAGKGLTSWLSFVVSNFPIGILAQVWYLIVSIPDLCTLTYFVTFLCRILGQVWYLIVLIPAFCHLSYFYSYGFFFNCTTVGQVTDSMTTHGATGLSAVCEWCIS